MRGSPRRWLARLGSGLLRCYARGEASAVYDGARLPFADHAFDTTLVLLTLQHCARADAVLDEAPRGTRSRLVVLESVYRGRLERFWLDLLDPRVNRLRHAGRMPAAIDVRRPEAWRTLFEARGLRVMATRWIGPAWERLVHHPLLFVLERPGPVRARRVACRFARPGAPGDAQTAAREGAWNATT